MDVIGNIQVDGSGNVTVTINGETQKIDPEFLMMRVLANKRINITSQLLSQINQMNETNHKADIYNALIQKIHTVMPSDKNGTVAGNDFVNNVLAANNGKFGENYLDKAPFDWASYESDGKFTYNKLHDMLDDLRNKITSLNNLNSETQLKIKETQIFRDETTEWQNTALDKLSRLFEKINQ